MAKWITPAGTIPGLCKNILTQPHILIAGATNSGKSVLINSIIYTALYQAPAKMQLVLIDPKRVELVKYKQLPHTIRYASEPEEMRDSLEFCVDLMEKRYKTMQKLGIVKSRESHVYIIIDEFADLMTTQKRETLPLLCRIAQLGRAANIHLIIATQRPTRDIVNGQIKVNIDSRVALRCPTAQDSRNIINVKGAETLPRHGQGYYYTPEGLRLVRIPMIDEDELAERVRWWAFQETWLGRTIMCHRYRRRAKTQTTPS